MHTHALPVDQPYETFLTWLLRSSQGKAMRASMHRTLGTLWQAYLSVHTDSRLARANLVVGVEGGSGAHGDGGVSRVSRVSRMSGVGGVGGDASTRSSFHSFLFSGQDDGDEIKNNNNSSSSSRNQRGSRLGGGGGDGDSTEVHMSHYFHHANACILPEMDQGALKALCLVLNSRVQKRTRSRSVLQKDTAKARHRQREFCTHHWRSLMLELKSKEIQLSKQSRHRDQAEDILALPAAPRWSILGMDTEE